MSAFRRPLPPGDGGFLKHVGVKPVPMPRGDLRKVIGEFDRFVRTHGGRWPERRVVHWEGGRVVKIVMTDEVASS